MKIARLWVSVCLAGLVVGCGQKGPLVHPDAPKHKRVAPSPPAATAPGTTAPSPPPAGTPPDGSAPAATDPPPNP